MSSNPENATTTTPSGPPQSQPPGVLSRAEILRRLKREIVRFKTFEPGWVVNTHSTHDPKILANAGFFYFNDSDKVQCAFCLGIVGNWETTDDPYEEHKRHFPRCPFMLGLPVGNCPYDYETNTTLDPSNRHSGFDIAGIRQPNQGPARKFFENTTRIVVNPGNHISDLNIQPRIPPAMPAFQSLDSRIKTFRNWPIQMKQKPSDMAKAGFYYTGVSDEVKCFQCDQGLNGWEMADDPWTEHEKWKPDCPLFKLMKKKPTHSTAETTAISPPMPPQPAIPPPMSPQSLESSKQLKEPFEQKDDFENMYICKVCWEKPVSVVILPCSHLCTCSDCAACLKTCPICRENFKGFVKAYVS